MNSKILRELCELAYQSCKIELDGARTVNTDKLPGVLLALIDAYTYGTGYVDRETDGSNEPNKYTVTQYWNQSGTWMTRLECNKTGWAVESNQYLPRPTKQEIETMAEWLENVKAKKTKSEAI